MPSGGRDEQPPGLAAWAMLVGRLDIGRALEEVRVRTTRRWLGVAALLAVVSGVAGCGGSPAGPSTSGIPSAPTSSSSAAPLTIPITISKGQVQPNGEKIAASLGQPIVLEVTSDEADEIHAHTGGDGYEVEVPANQPTTGTFTPSQPGSFEIESHHLEKVVVILNVS